MVDCNHDLLNLVIRKARVEDVKFYGDAVKGTTSLKRVHFVGLPVLHHRFLILLSHQVSSPILASLRKLGALALLFFSPFLTFSSSSDV